MSVESPKPSEQEAILLDIKNLFINNPNEEAGDDAIEQWGKQVEAKQSTALELGIPIIDIEYAKLQGMFPKDREYYLTTLTDDIDISIEKGETPYISKSELKNLKRRVKTLNKRPDL